jgi:hypothetical protein
MIIPKSHRLFRQPPEICIIRTLETPPKWVLYIFDGETFYPAHAIGSWPSEFTSTKIVIETAKKCQMTREWKDYTIAIYYGGQAFSEAPYELHERRVIDSDADIIQHILANG